MSVRVYCPTCKGGDNAIWEEKRIGKTYLLRIPLEKQGWGLLSERPIRDRVEELIRRTKEWAREHPVQAAFVGVLAISLLLAASEHLRWRWAKPK